MTPASPGARRLINEFLACRRIAVVGASRDPRDYTAHLFREFLKLGYDAVPVNPQATELDGRACFPRVQDIQPPVEAALLLTTPEATAQVIDGCAQAGLRLIWMRRTADAGVMEFCAVRGLRVIAGHCPFMFLRGAAWFHRLHGWVLRLTGSYPE
jgi:predicted CoA-binding protein